MVKERNPDYELVASGHLGRSNSVEQYTFFYKKSKLSLTGEWQYPDHADYFERPPYFARFTTKVDYPYGAIDIAFGNVHTKPADAVAEIGNLTKVYDDIYWLWKPAVVLFGGKLYTLFSFLSKFLFILLGDFNADCKYVSKSKWDSIPLWTNSTFTWLIETGIDTTSSLTNVCTCKPYYS